MNNKKPIDDATINSSIKRSFDEGLKDIAMGSSLKERLIKLPEEAKTLTPLQALLEKELCFPIASIPAFALSFIILIAISLNSLILPERLPEPEYKIIEMTNSSMYVSDRNQ